MKLQSFRICTLAVLFAGTPLITTHAQTTSAASAQTADATQKADSPAMILVRRAINAMGGDAAWSGVGSASLQLSVANAQNQKSFTTVRQDDWSKGYARMRADSAVGTTGKILTTLDLPGALLETRGQRNGGFSTAVRFGCAGGDASCSGTSPWDVTV